MADKKKYKDDTKLMHVGIDPDSYHGLMNPPISRGSTYKYPSLAAYEDPDHKYRYGRYTSPMAEHFGEALALLEGGYKALPTPSGMSAITVAFLSFLNAGDHVLVSDALYPPARDFCDRTLPRMGVEVTYFDPLIDEAGLKALLKENTKVIHFEVAGSATYEIPDFDMLVKVAKAHDIVTICDNSWASGILFKPLEHGFDVSVLSCTKYIGGHADIMLGAIIARDEALYRPMKTTHKDLGICVAPEDMALALRGVRTLNLRMKATARSALTVAQWLEGREEVARVFYPGLEADANYATMKQYFKGCNGILSIELVPVNKEAVRVFVEGLDLFPIGSSWGGFESLLQPQHMNETRTAVPWTGEGFVMRLQIGLEDPDDLIADLEQGFAIFNAAR